MENWTNRLRYLIREQILLLEMSVQRAADIFDINPANINKKELQKLYRKLSMKFHPDRGGSVQKQQEINVAYDVLKKNIGSPIKTSQESKEDWDKKMKRRRTIVENVIKNNVDTKEYIEYFQNFIDEKFYYDIDESDPITYKKRVSDYVIEYTFYTKTRDTVFYIKMHIDLLRFDTAHQIGGEFPFFTINYVYHNNRKHKMKRRDWSFRNNTEIFEPESMFPSNKLQKIFSSSKARKFSKRDFLTGMKRLFNADWDGTYLFIPIKNGIEFVLNRDVFQRIAYWDIFGFYENRRLSQRPKNRIMFTEDEKHFEIIVDAIRKFKKMKTVDEMVRYIDNRLMKELKY